MPWTIENQTVLITGGSSGLGMATAQALAAQGANVTITSRDGDRVARAARNVSSTTGFEVSTATVDLADMASVRAFAEQYTADHGHIGVLVNNAGGVFGSRRETIDGHEMTFGTNHLGPFLLTQLLLGHLGGDAPSRVINVSSVAHTYAKDGILFDDHRWQDRPYRMMDVYGHSKLANILHALAINDRTGDDVEAFAVHPGVVATSFGGRGGSLIVRATTMFGRPWMRSVEEGADSIIWLATDPTVSTSDGVYFSDRKPEKSTRHAKDHAQADRLWVLSEELASLR